MSNDQPVTDLVTRAANGDKQAWDALVERYTPLIWSICRRHQLADADARDVGQNVWLRLVDQLAKIRNPAALPGWLATTTRRECGRMLRAARGTAGGRVCDWTRRPSRTSRPRRRNRSCWRPSATPRCARRSLDLPPSGQRLIALLLEDPPVPYAEISARLGIPVGSIGPTRRRCLDKLRQHPAITELVIAETEMAR